MSGWWFFFSKLVPGNMSLNDAVGSEVDSSEVVGLMVSGWDVAKTKRGCKFFS